MDQEVARTLGELERKLRELERTLHAMSAAEPPPPGGGWSRIVDETIERSQAPAAAPGVTPARVRSPAGAPWPPRAPLPPDSAPPAAHAPSAAGGPPERVPAEYGRQQRGRSPQAPGAAELLRFRERLEHAARELTHDYDELLGRLSYAAVPSTAGPTISFARGAPSLDIVDVDGLRDAAVRAFESDPAGTTAYGTSIGYPRLRSWIADRHGVEPERVLVTNGSMQADAFLFEQLVKAGDEVIVERPTYDRTLLSLRERGARVHAVQLRARRDRHGRARRAALRRWRRRAADARAHHPQLPEPRRLHAVAGEAHAPAGAGRRAQLHRVRGRPLRGPALQRRAAADDAVDGP